MAMHHDTGYKELFSPPAFVEALLEGFIPRPVSELLDYRTLSSQPGHYITPLFDLGLQLPCCDTAACIRAARTARGHGFLLDCISFTAIEYGGS